MIVDDGVSLTSIAHPRGSWWSWLKFKLFAPRLDDAALETMEIDIPDHLIKMPFHDAEVMWSYPPKEWK